MPQKRQVIVPILDKKRTVLLHGMIETRLTSIINTKLTELSLLDPRKPINLHISSEGGDFWDMLSILETMNSITAPVYTTGMGYCFSGAALILAAGKNKHRLLGKNSWVMIHELSAEFVQQKMSDLEVEYEWTKSCNDQLLELLALYTGTSIKSLKKNLVKDYPLKAEDALQFGIVDKLF